MTNDVYPSFLGQLDRAPCGDRETGRIKLPGEEPKELQGLFGMIHMPHFRTKNGKEFTFEQISEALSYLSKNGEKAVLKLT